MFQPPSPLFHHQANLSQLFECLFVNFLARKLCCKILCANIVFACFCCAKRQRPDAPLRSPPFPSRCREFLVLQRKLYQCASLFSGVSLPSFLLSFFLAVVCLLGLLFSFRAFVFDLRSAMYWYFQRLFVSFSLTLLLLLLYSVLFSWLPACCVQRATCSAAASFLCIRFYFITLFFGNFLKTQTWEVAWNICGASCCILFSESFQINCAIEFVTMSKDIVSYLHFKFKFIQKVSPTPNTLTVSTSWLENTLQ